MPERPVAANSQSTFEFHLLILVEQITMSKLQKVFDCPKPVALVTGSGSPRVGRAIAIHLASLGCRIALHANTSIEHDDGSLVCGAFEISPTSGRLRDGEGQPRGRRKQRRDSSLLRWGLAGRHHEGHRGDEG